MSKSMTSLSKKVERILFDLVNTHDNTYAGLEETAQTILEAVKEIVPDERNTISDKPMDKLKEHERVEFINNVGFNQCRKEILERIK